MVFSSSLSNFELVAMCLLLCINRSAVDVNYILWLIYSMKREYCWSQNGSVRHTQFNDISYLFYFFYLLNEYTYIENCEFMCGGVHIPSYIILAGRAYALWQHRAYVNVTHDAKNDRIANAKQI